MNNLNYSFMAFASGKSSEVTEVKRYIGVAPVYAIAVNPNKKQLEEIYNTTVENEPSYISENEDKVKQVRIDFITKTDPEKCNGIEITPRVTFFISNEVRYNRDKTKVQVINKYGETTWLPVEDAKAGRVPESLSWFEPADFRPAYVGEEELTGFIRIIDQLM